MTGMEHAIEQAARVLIAHPSIPNHKDVIRDVCPSCPDADVAGPNSPSHAAHQARALAEAGLLSTAPEPRADFADAWDEGWEACHAFMGRGIFPPRTNPYREPVDGAEGDGSADQ